MSFLNIWQKGTKNALETGRTFATIFADMDFRQRLLDVHGEAEFKGILLKHAQDLASEQSNPTRRLGNLEPDGDFDVSQIDFNFHIIFQTQNKHQFSNTNQ